MAVGDWCGSLANLKVKVKVIFFKKKRSKKVRVYPYILYIVADSVSG